MIKQIKFFKLNKDLSLPEINLGDSIDYLKKSGHILENKLEGKTEYRYYKNEKIWIGDEFGKVKYIHFTRETGCDFFGIDPYDFPYPSTDPITEYFSKFHKKLTGINTMEEFKACEQGNYLIIIFSDYIPRNIYLIKKTEPNII